jgi:hypothetical protein
VPVGEPDPEAAGGGCVVVRSRFPWVKPFEALAAAGHAVLENKGEPVEYLIVARHDHREFVHHDRSALDGRGDQSVKQVGETVKLA